MREVVNKLNAIKDIAEVPMEDRQQLLKASADQLPIARASQTEQVEAYVRDMLTIVDELTSCDFGDRPLQDALCQQMVFDCLTMADRISVDSEFRLVSQLRLGPSRNLDADGQKVSGSKWQALRSQIMGHRLRLWYRINSIIDPQWNPDDSPMMNVAVPGGMYPSGVAPESIREPEIRKQYEAALEANRKKAEKHLEQRSARDMRDRYLPSLKAAITDAYSMGPVTADDLDVLKAYLRINVSDKKLRAELFQVAEAAAKKAQDGKPKPNEKQ
jgi:hypothetical protein